MNTQLSRKRDKASGSRICGGSGGTKRPRTDPTSPRLSEKEVNQLGMKFLNACCYGKTAEAKRLIAEGAPVEWQNGDGRAPLHLASGNGHTEIVMLLLENKCNLNITDKLGNTPLIYAACTNRMDTVRALVEAGADTTIRNNENTTAAEWAKKEGHHDVANYLTTIRFHSSAQHDSGQLYHVKGRSKRAIERDLKEITNFDDHMLHRLQHFCIGKR